MKEVCENGLKVNNSPQQFNLGKAEQGVYVCKNADLTFLEMVSKGHHGYVIMFKLMKVITINLVELDSLHKLGLFIKF